MCRHKKHRYISVPKSCSSVRAFYLKKGLSEEITFKGNSFQLHLRCRTTLQCFAGPQEGPGLASGTEQKPASQQFAQVGCEGAKVSERGKLEGCPSATVSNSRISSLKCIRCIRLLLRVLSLQN